MFKDVKQLKQLTQLKQLKQLKQLEWNSDDEGSTNIYGGKIHTVVLSKFCQFVEGV